LECSRLHNLTEDAIAAQAMAVRLPELDVIDRQMERARATRLAIARDIVHHRVAGSCAGLGYDPDNLAATLQAGTVRAPRAFAPQAGNAGFVVQPFETSAELL
jgi:hypothetical protein